MTEPDSLHAVLAAARAFAKKHAAQCAAEIIEWQDKAILPDGKLRELAAMCLPLESNHSLKLAERLVSREGLVALASRIDWTQS